MNDPLGLFEENQNDPLGLFSEEPSLDKQLGKLGTLTKGVGTAALDLVGGIPGFIAGAGTGAATAIGHMDATGGLEVAKDIMEKTTPSTALGIDVKGNKGYEYAMKPIEWFNDLLGFSAKGYGEIAKALGTSENSVKQVSSAAELSLLAGMAVGGLKGKGKAKVEDTPNRTKAADAFAAESAGKDPLGLFEPTNETHQMPLFEQDQMGQQRSPYGGGKGEWRVDENGIPVRTDISMEAANLEQPLQRNLWGDELGPKSEQEALPITQAMDNTRAAAEGAETLPEAAAQRDLMTQQQDLLSHEMPAGNDLKAAMLEADHVQRPYAPEAPTAPITNRGRMGRQRGAIDLSVFKEGYKGVAKHLSKLTDALGQDIQWQEAMKASLGGKDMMRNGDGTPLVLLHGTTRTITGNLRGGEQGFHAGFVTSPHQFTQKATIIPDRAGHKGISRANQTKENAQLHPVVIKKGNYPFLKFDAGDWSPERLMFHGNERSPFMQWFKDEMHKKGYTDSQIDGFRNFVSNQVGTTATNRAFMDVLRRIDVDGFFYRNVAESPHKYKTNRVYERYSEDGTRAKALEKLNQISQDPTSFVTWSNDNFKSIYDHEAPTNSSGTIRSPGNRQMGGIWMGAESIPPEQRPKAPDTVKNPTSPETIAAKEQARAVAKQFPVKNAALDEFNVVSTLEEAIALSRGVKDIVRDLGQKMLGAGINFQAVMSNSPALKFARTVFRDARIAAEQFSNKYITDNSKGLSPIWSKLKTSERIAVMDALMTGDHLKREVTDGVMDRMGFNDAQRQFVKTFYEADSTMYNRGNKALQAVGLKLVDHREGHFPGIFTGAYKTLVMDGKKVIGVIATDTRWQREAAREYYKKENPTATFIDKDRTGLTGAANRYYSDIFSGMSDVMQMLGEHDPRFAEVQAMVSKAITEGNNHLFNFNVHELAKKGITGSEGNRPWLSPERNANDAFKALVRYFEEGALHHELQKPLKDVRDLISSPELEKLPNTQKYLDAYVKKITGKDISPLGAAANTALDAFPRLIGVGPSVPIKLAAGIKNNMSQLFMGWGNYVFTMSQFVQPGQTGLPFMQLAAGRLGLNALDVTASAAKAASNSMLLLAEHMTGKHMDAVIPHMREAFEYAKARGMLTFSEMERAYQGTQTKIGRAKDTVAEVNMKLGEQMTRAPMFMAFTDLLVKGGIDVKAALPIAENLTQFVMIDYHAWERPSLYSKMGVMGQFAGGLTTFKHGYASQQVKLGQELVKPVKLRQGSDGAYVPAKRQMAPIGLSIAAMMALAGITGSPFYNELDSAYQYLTNKFGDEAKTIRESFLQNSPEWLNSGAVSNALDLNIQGKFSSADMVPDTMAKAMSPHLEAAGQIIGNAIDMAKNGADAQSVRNLLISITPSGWKGVTENALARDENNNLIGKDGLPAAPTPARTDKEWDMRALTGLRPQREALEREGTWAARQKQMKDMERQKEISKEYKRAIINGTDQTKAAKLETEYQKRGGDIKNLLNLYQEAALEKQQTQKERMEGIPKDAQSIHRWEYYNK
jgi:hypothetical protein